jgi:hypothetical protein
LLRLHNREGAHDIDNDVIAAGCVGVEEDAVQHRWSGEFNPCFFAQFAAQRRFGRFPDLHSATRKMPAPHVGVLDEKDAIVFVDDGAPHADREGMEEAAIDRVQARDQAFCICHSSL